MSGQPKTPLEDLLRSKGPEFAAQIEAAYAESRRRDREKLKSAPAPQTDRGEG